MTVFISYSHQNEDALAELLTFIEPLRREGLLEIWIDRYVEGGELWEAEIEKFLAEADVAILLISQPFLASPFITGTEIPRLLSRSDKRQVTILPVFLSTSTVEADVSELTKIQGYGTPERPLADLAPPARQREFKKLAERLRALAETRGSPDLSQPPPIRLIHLGVGRRSLLFVLLLMGFQIYYSEIRHPSPDSRELTELLHRGCWVTYDPRDFNPFTSPDPGLSSMKSDLETIRRSGFSGIVTFGSRGSLSEIPRLAKEMDLKVIMGIWDPNDVREIRAAIRQKPYADAYCVGHNGLDHPDGYDIEQLERVILLVKRRTGRPATTTEMARSYDEDLAGIGDWLFPDVHFLLLDQLRAEPCADGEECEAELDPLLQDVARLAQEAHKPLMLKMVSYPWRGDLNASRENQARLLASLLEEIHSGRGLPHPTGVVIHSAFDISWKHGDPFYSWDAYTGVLEPDGNPSLAVPGILKRCNEPRNY